MVISSVVVVISVSIFFSVELEDELELELELDDLTQTEPCNLNPSGHSETIWHLSSFKIVPSGHLVGMHFPFLKTWSGSPQKALKQVLSFRV